MINPIVIIVTAALLLSVLAICIINKPKKPIITGTLIFILACFVVTTWIIDNTISNFSSTGSFISFVSFVTMLDNPTYSQLEEAFDIFMTMDIVFFVLSLLSLVLEAVNILKNDKRK